MAAMAALRAVRVDRVALRAVQAAARVVGSAVEAEKVPVGHATHLHRRSTAALDRCRQSNGSKTPSWIQDGSSGSA